MKRQGKCENYASCLLAYRNETITLSEGDFVCPECKQPLVPLTEAAKNAPVMIPSIIVGGIVALIVIGAAALWIQAKRFPTKPTASPLEQAQAALENQGSLKPLREETTPAPSEAPAEPESPPMPMTAASAPNLDLQNSENQQVKIEVLKRIDLMPTISAENKDKLYVSVERARQMGKIVTIPFASGKTALGSGDGEKLKATINSPQLQQLLQDPTCVFVILGFADTKGDEKTNLRISQERAQSVLNTLRDKCDIINLMHAVAMGGSSLFDPQGVEKNRVAEIWAVLP